MELMSSLNISTCHFRGGVIVGVRGVTMTIGWYHDDCRWGHKITGVGSL